MMRNFCFSGIAAMLLANMAACSSTDKVAEQREALAGHIDVNAHTYVFKCEDDYSFIARTENDMAWLFLRRETLKLPKAPSASGMKYSDGENTFWIKGNEAMFSTSKRTHEDCLNNQRKAIWEHAKLNGVDFRAVGNEPGWVLEISNKTDIQLITNYGQSHHNFASTEVTSATQGLTTIFEGKNKRDQIEITITGTRCGDSMSNEMFPVTVDIQLNENVYRGCGRALH